MKNDENSLKNFLQSLKYHQRTEEYCSVVFLSNEQYFCTFHLFIQSRFHLYYSQPVSTQKPSLWNI